jgi:hypothetical protein
MGHVPTFFRNAGFEVPTVLTVNIRSCSSVNEPMFRRKILPLSSGLKSKVYKKSA